jgi:hypothetical protein
MHWVVFFRAANAGRTMLRKGGSMGRERRIESKSQLTVLFLAYVTLAGAGCECVNPEAVNAWQPVDHQPYYSYWAGGLDFAVGLSGRWVHNDCPTTISVAPDGRSLIITDEFGRRSSAYMTGNRELVIPYSGIRGHVGCTTRHVVERHCMDWLFAFVVCPDTSLGDDQREYLSR